jgi:hypothetical protein
MAPKRERLKGVFPARMSTDSSRFSWPRAQKSGLCGEKRSLKPCRERNHKRRS